MSKPAGYYDWDFATRKKWDDAQLERENAEYEAMQASRAAERAARDARLAREFARTEIDGWQSRCDEINEEKMEIEAAYTELLGFFRSTLNRLREIHDNMNPAVALDAHNDLRDAIADIDAELKQYR